MASILVTIFDVINLVREARSTLYETAEETQRLCERVQSFELPVRRLQSEDATVLEKILPTLNMLEEALINAHDFVCKYQNQQSLWHKFLKLSFRKTYYSELKGINNRLQQAGADLQFNLIVDHEVRRREDMESFNKNMVMAIEQSVLQLQQSSSSSSSAPAPLDPQVADGILLEIKTELAGSNSLLNNFLIDMGHRAMSEEESLVQQKMQNELLDKAKVQFDAIMSAIKEVNANQQYIIDILQESIALNAKEKAVNDERNGRLSRLKSLAISNSDITNVGKIERGGQGEILLASYQSNSVALKIFKSYDANGAQEQELSHKQRRIAENELLLLDYLKGPSIVICYGYIPDVKIHTLVLEMAPFGSLWDLLNDHENFPMEHWSANVNQTDESKHGPKGNLGFRRWVRRTLDLPLKRDNEVRAQHDAFPLTLKIAWMADILTALKFLHSKGVRHKDIKAQNILVFDHLKLKVCDFGLSKSANTVSISSSSNVSNASNLGVGTGPFIAPEIRLFGHSEASSDMFSFGITAVQILTRSIPGIKDWENQIDNALASAFESHDFYLKLNGISNDESSAKIMTGLSAVLKACVSTTPASRPIAERGLESMQHELNAVGGDPRELFRSDIMSDRCREIEEIARRLETSRMQLLSPHYRPSEDDGTKRISLSRAKHAGSMDIDASNHDDGSGGGDGKNRVNSGTTDTGRSFSGSSFTSDGIKNRSHQSSRVSSLASSRSDGNDAKDRRLLASLTVPEVCYMMHQNNFHCIDNIKQQNINGLMLTYVSSEQDIVDLGIQIKSVHLRRLFDLIEDYKNDGVDDNIFKSADSIENSYLIRPIPTADDVKIIEELNQTTAALQQFKIIIQFNEEKIQQLENQLKEEREAKSKLLIKQNEERSALLEREKELERERQALKLKARRQEIKSAPIESIFLTPSNANAAGDNSGLSLKEVEVINLSKDLASNNQFLIEDALIKIGNLCSLDSKAQDTYGTMEFCTKITIAMNVFMTQARLVSKACVAITKLDNVKNRQTLGDAGACRAVSEALSRHASDGEVVTHAIEAISWLSNLPSNKATFKVCGTKEALERSTAVHKKNSAIQEIANACIIKLST